MMRLETVDGTPVFPGILHMNSKQAELHASRALGKDWSKRGYVVRPWSPKEGS